MGNNTKPCPYCGEEIMMKAVKCKHCGEWLNQEARKKNEPVVKRETRKKPEPVAKEIGLGCLTLVAAYSIPAIIIGLILHFTIPDDSRMERAIVENVQECVVDEAQSYTSLVSDDLSGLASLLLSNDVSAEVISQQFEAANDVEIDRSWFWSTGKIYNNQNLEGSTVCFGILGIVIPFVTWDDFSLAEY